MLEKYAEHGSAQFKLPDILEVPPFNEWGNVIEIAARFGGGKQLHWNAEALGWHVSKRGTRHEALQATSMAVRQQFGHLGKDAARGLALRHDHGSAFMAEDFQNQIKAWGMLPSYAFVGQPETNGVIERFFRTFKEQVVHGRIFQTIDDFREAVRDFVLRYNTQWLVEKNGHLSPADARQRWLDQNLPCAA